MERRREIKWWRRKLSLTKIFEKALPSFFTILIIFATALATAFALGLVPWAENEIFDPTAKLTYNEFKYFEKNKTLNPNYFNNPANEEYKMEYKVSFNVSNRKKSNYDAYLKRVEYSIEEKNNTDSRWSFKYTSSKDWEVIRAGKNWTLTDTVVFNNWLAPGNYILTGTIHYDDGKGNIKHMKMVNDTIVI